MPRPVNRSCSTATAESTWWTPSPPAVPVASPTGSGTTDTSTAATDDPARMPIWQPDTGGCWCCHHLAAEHGRRWSGACILQHRSTNYAPATAVDSVGVTTPAHASDADGRDMSHAPFLPPTWARSVVLTNSACRSWINGSSPVVRCWPAGRRDRRVRPVVSPLRMRGCAARQRDPAAGARTAGVAPDDIADHDPPLLLHRLWAGVAPGHQPGRRAAGEAVASRAAMALV